jgi:hypothetical protein
MFSKRKAPKPAGAKTNSISAKGSETNATGIPIIEPAKKIYARSAHPILLACHIRLKSLK